MSKITKPAADEPAIDAEALKKAEQFIEAEEGASNKLRGALGIFVSATAVVMSLFHLYTAYAIVPTQVLRPVHVGFVLFLSYLLFPASKRYGHRIMRWDWAAAFAAVAVIAYILQGGDDGWERTTSPDNWDIVFAVALMLLILEGVRRASGRVRAGDRNKPRRRLAAARGCGALIATAVLGAAGLLIAEFLIISYRHVLLMATNPTLLYYVARVLIVESADRNFGMRTVKYVH